LGHADEDDTLIAAEASKTSFRDLLFALSFLEVQERNSVSLGEGFHGLDERAAHLAQQSGGDDRLAAVVDQKANQAALGLETRLVTVEKDTVEAFDLQSGVLSEYRFHVRHESDLETCVDAGSGRSGGKPGRPIMPGPRLCNDSRS
jgi:hypothetical protein